ncbi:MAG: ATP-dependent sacrificial sulfur transferase LarE [Proteobacteria bacterium]|nr:ATP-dependent sacrificial sulfur transferase LarE [Cystobacterineae bacterium]MCL2259013.1 ATP-dependent sacrificial sulfur transferase LarE [Cystobacterineae bacterium]MCL2314633.1 ATP-dependent sacrificial sulfur transferase LarE [Pseudomonadota bacterium]
MPKRTQATESLWGQPRLREVCEKLKPFSSALVALSGGVDSGLVLKLAQEVLGSKHVVAATARSAFFTQEEMESAKVVAEQLGVRHCWLEAYPLEDADIVKNGWERCFFCKRNLVRGLKELQAQLALDVILDGSHAGDELEHRPGRRALREGNIYSVLAEAGFSKQEIRTYALQLGLPNWDRPQAACLATRIPYGEALSASTLERIACAEAALRQMGLREFRIRHHGEIARIEIGQEAFASLADIEFRAQCIRALQAAGYRFATVDLEVFRSGRMNDKRP